jgi:hypothetical protein
VLGTDLAAGERPQVVVPAGVWQSAERLADWVLVGCTVFPAFDFGRSSWPGPGGSLAGEGAFVKVCRMAGFGA